MRLEDDNGGQRLGSTVSLHPLGSLTLRDISSLSRLVPISYLDSVYPSHNRMVNCLIYCF